MEIQIQRTLSRDRRYFSYLWMCFFPSLFITPMRLLLLSQTSKYQHCLLCLNKCLALQCQHRGCRSDIWREIGVRESSDKVKSSRSTANTRAPSDKKRSTVDLPIPDAAPVTIATLLVKRLDIYFNKLPILVNVLS